MKSEIVRWVMKQFILTLIIFLVAIYALAAEPKKVQIFEQCVYLDDLAGKNFPHKAISCGFDAGMSKVFTKEAVSNYLLREGFREQASQDVLIFREGVALTEEVISQAVLAKYSETYPELRIEIDQIRVPANIYVEDIAEVDILVDSSKLGSNYATIKANNRKVQAYYYVRAFQTAFIATDRIRAGEQISDKAKESEVEVTNLKGRAVSSVENMIATRAMAPGRIITHDLVQDKPLLRKGESVRIIYNDGVLKIETAGIVEENVTNSQVVPVRNVTSQKVIMAKYIGNGIVQANF